MLHETCVTIPRMSEVIYRGSASVPKLHRKMSTVSKTYLFSCSVVFVLLCGICFVLKKTAFPFHVAHVSVSRFYSLSNLLSSGCTFIKMHYLTPSDHSSKHYCKCIRHAGSIRHAKGSIPLQPSALPPELHPALHIFALKLSQKQSI